MYGLSTIQYSECLNFSGSPRHEPTCAWKFLGRLVTTLGCTEAPRSAISLSVLVLGFPGFNFSLRITWVKLNTPWGLSCDCPETKLPFDAGWGVKTGFFVVCLLVSSLLPVEIGTKFPPRLVDWDLSLISLGSLDCGFASRLLMFQLMLGRFHFWSVG